jgi:hypothetical protein
MIARLDHRPITITVALATVVCVLLLVVALFFTEQLAPTSLPSDSPAGAPAHSDIIQTTML